MRAILNHSLSPDDALWCGTNIKHEVCMRSLLLCFLILLAVACVPQPKPTNVGPSHTVQGDVAYRERMALPDGAVLWVQLAQVDDKGRTLLILDEYEQRAQGQVPLPFSLVYDGDKLHDGGTYALLARILYQDTSIFASTAPMPLTLPTDVPQHMVLHRPEPLSTAPFHAPTARELTGKRWELRSLYGVPVERFSDERIPGLSFLPDERRINGHDGCNGLSAPYSAAGERVDIGQAAGTLKMCFNGMDQARAMAQAMQEADNWRVSGRTLELRRADRLIATFEGVSL